MLSYTLNKNRIILFAILILSLFLNFYNLGTRDFIAEEAFNARLTTTDLSVIRYRYNPVYILSLHLCSKFKSPEFSLRSLSVFFGILSIIVLSSLLKNIFNSQVAILTVFLFSISPFFVFFTRQAIPYSMFLFFSLCNLYLYLRLLKENRYIYWLGYFVLTILGIFVHEAIIYLILLETLFLLCAYKHNKKVIKRWFLLNSFIVIIFLVFISLIIPWRLKWLFSMSLHADNYSFLPWAVVGKIFYVFYLFSLGQTVFPWNWLIVIPAIMVFSFLLGYALIKLRFQKEKLYFFIVFLFSPIILLNFLKNFYPRYFFPILPLYFALIAFGISNIKFKLVKVLSVFIVVFISFYSLFNYYTGKEYHNNIYLDPWRKVAGYIKTNSQPEDIIILVRPNIPFEYYYRGGAFTSNIYSLLSFAEKKNNGIIDDPQGVFNQIKPGYKRIWFIKNAPGLMLPNGITDRQLLLISDRFNEWLNKHFQLIENRKYFKDTYAQNKRKFINKVFVDYRIILSLYSVNY